MKVWVTLNMSNYTNVESILELHNIDETMINDGACVQMNSRGDLNIADCGDTYYVICEIDKMSCEQLGW